MERHFQRELESLKTSLIKMGSVVEENIAFAIRSVLEKRNDLTHKVIETDKRVDALEIEIDNAVIDLLALQQPVASDLRFIIAAQKINNDLERIGDHAVNIAEAAETICSLSKVEMLEEIPTMADITKMMLKDALDSFILLDPAKARLVLELNRVSRNLERVADLATNIAEEVIFQTQARVVKHHADEKEQSKSTS